MAQEPENLVLVLLREIRADVLGLGADVRGLDAKIDVTRETLRAEIAATRQELRAEMAAGDAAIRKELGEQMTGMRHAVMQYHSSVIGHGVLISDLDARVRRVEQHLNLPPMQTH